MLMYSYKAYIVLNSKDSNYIQLLINNTEFKLVDDGLYYEDKTILLPHLLIEKLTKELKALGLGVKSIKIIVEKGVK